MRTIYFLCALIIAAASCYINTASADDCKDLYIIFARGSGEAKYGQNYQTFKSELSAILNHMINYEFIDLDYPAISLNLDSATGFFSALGAYVSAGSAYAFGESVDDGVNKLVSYVNNKTVWCQNSKFIIGGYSQGAQVVSKAIQILDPDNILYAATFGDPKLYLPEGAGLIPDACRGKNYSSYRVHVPDCHAHNGILSGYKPYQPNEKWSNKLGTWCNKNDIMCSSGININDHTSYVSENIYHDAAKVINQKINKHFFNNETISTTHNVAILIDTTLSMSKVINQYRAEAIRLADKTFAANGKVALFVYRDLNDPFTPVQLCDFDSCNKDNFTSLIYQITTDGGGDDLESALSASLHVMNELRWERGATKSIILLTDACYHSPDLDGVTLNDVINRSLEIDPVNFFVITNPNIADGYQELAKATNGKVFTSTNDFSLETNDLLSRPTAILSADNYQSLINQAIHYDASKSLANSKIIKYEWDLDGDGAFEAETESPYFTHTYLSPADFYIQVKITDSNKRSSTASAHVNITDGFTLPTITKAEAKIINQDEIQIDYYSSDDTKGVLLILNDFIVGKLDPTQKKAILTNIHSEKELNISLVPYSNKKGEIKNVFNKEIISVPNCGVSV